MGLFNITGLIKSKLENLAEMENVTRAIFSFEYGQESVDTEVEGYVKGAKTKTVKKARENKEGSVIADAVLSKIKKQITYDQIHKIAMGS